MNSPDQCRVGECERSAAAAISRDDLPGPLRLCATHLEEFRQNNVDWAIDWSQGTPEPTSVSTPVSAAVGLSGPNPAQAIQTQQPAGRSALKSLLQSPGRAVQRMEARRVARRKNHP
jgi:hypothetical protein